MKIATHNGNFHADDVFAVATLLLIYPEAEVVRTRDEKVISAADIAVDVGLEYDPLKLRFDHHQPEGAGKRENGIPYASFGLVWKQFGEKLAGDYEAAAIIEEKLVMPIDAIDNGVEVSVSNFGNIKEYNIGDYLNSYMEGAETMDELDAVFDKVITIARNLMEREVASAKNVAEDWREARRIYDESEDKKIIILPKPISWKRVLIPTEAVFIISQRPDGKWQARGVPERIGVFKTKKPFPVSWSGRRDEELVELSGVSDAVFSHHDNWLAVAKSKEGALELARIALNS